MKYAILAAVLLLAASANAQNDIGNVAPAANFNLPNLSVVDTLKNGNIKFNYTLFLAPHGNYVAVASVPTMVQNYGCGSDGSKCRCESVFDPKMAVPTAIVMSGIGTDGTATGLDFSCAFSVSFYDSATRTTLPGCDCTLAISMPFAGSNTWKRLCPCVGGFMSQVPPKAWEVSITDTVSWAG